MSQIIFSVVIPTYKRESLLKEAIASVLSQKYDASFEILVVDDEPCLTPPSPSLKIISQFNDDKIKYFQNEKNLGCFENMNKCIQLAKYEYIVMLHNDDVLYDSYLSTMQNVLQNNKNIDMLFSDEKVKINGMNVDKTGYYKINSYLRKFINIDNCPIKIIQSDFFIHNIVGGPTGVIFKKSKAAAIGYLDNSHYPVSDYYFWSKYTSSYNVYMIPNELSEYRQEENITLADGIYPRIFEQSYKLQKSFLKEETVKGILARIYSYESIRLRILSINTKSDLSLNIDECYTSATGDIYQSSITKRIVAQIYLYKKGIDWIFRVLFAKYLCSHKEK